MMRLRRASVIAFSLLTSTATANAECAWVMWEHVWYTGATQHLPGYGQTWTPTGAVKTQSDCERGQASMERQWSALAKLSPNNELDKSVQWICLPDTVDPRGEKRKCTHAGGATSEGHKQGARHGVSNDYSPLLLSPDGRNPRATSPSVTPSPA